MSTVSTGDLLLIAVEDEAEAIRQARGPLAAERVQVLSFDPRPRSGIAGELATASHRGVSGQRRRAPGFSHFPRIMAQAAALARQMLRRIISRSVRILAVVDGTGIGSAYDLRGRRQAQGPVGLRPCTASIDAAASPASHPPARHGRRAGPRAAGAKLDCEFLPGAARPKNDPCAGRLQWLASALAWLLLYPCLVSLAGGASANLRARLRFRARCARSPRWCSSRVSSIHLLWKSSPSARKPGKNCARRSGEIAPWLRQCFLVTVEGRFCGVPPVLRRLPLRLAIAAAAGRRAADRGPDCRRHGMAEGYSRLPAIAAEILAAGRHGRISQLVGLCRCRRDGNLCAGAAPRGGPVHQLDPRSRGHRPVAAGGRQCESHVGA